MFLDKKEIMPNNLILYFSKSHTVYFPKIRCFSYRELQINNFSRILQNLTNDADAKLYGTKFSTDFLCLTKILARQRHQSYTVQLNPSNFFNSDTVWYIRHAACGWFAPLPLQQNRPTHLNA